MIKVLLKELTFKNMFSVGNFSMTSAKSKLAQVLTLSHQNLTLLQAISIQTIKKKLTSLL